MVPRRRFTVRRQSDGHIVVEDVQTGLQARVAGLEEIGEQIGRWLEAGEPDDHALATTRKSRSPER